jgi:hypothetical protein
MRMPTFFAVTSVLAVGLCATTQLVAQPNQPTQPPPSLDAQVVDAMQKGIDFLLKQRQTVKLADGKEVAHFDSPVMNLPFITFKGPPEFTQLSIQPGETGLILYALLTAGASLDDTRLSYKSLELAPVVDYLRQATPLSTYGMALQAIALSHTPRRPETDATMRRLRDQLLKYSCTVELVKGRDGGTTLGGYTYQPAVLKGVVKGDDGHYTDMSNTQYAILAAWSLSDYGIEIPSAYWRVVDNYTRKNQLANGAWGYNPRGTGKDVYYDHQFRSMTAVGLATLFLTSDMTDTTLRVTPWVDKDIDAGLTWLTQNYKVDDFYYYMYALERVGLASGYKYLGNKDWYRDGVALMLAKQNKNEGYWGNIVVEPKGLHKENMKHGSMQATVSTAYVLAYLARGRNPVAFNKLQYEGAEDAKTGKPAILPWNARPRDIGNVTEKMVKLYERPMNWQIVNFNVAGTDWLDAPILFIAGSQDPKFTEAQLAKLREYITAGGIIFSSADGGSTAFTNAMRQYANKITEGKYEMRTVEKDDEIYTVENQIKNPPQLLTMNNGVRHMWVHSPVDLGASWQMRRYANSAHFEIPANLSFYAAGKMPLKSKLARTDVPAPSTPTKRTINLARVEFSGNWDPESGAWPRLARVLASQSATELKVASFTLDKLDPKTHPLAHLTATGALPFQDEQRQALKRYLDAGGFLLADAAGGNVEFTASLVDNLTKLYPNVDVTNLGPDHPLLQGNFSNGVKIENLEVRKYARLKRPGATGQLRLFSVDKKPLVLLAEEDLVSGLLGTNTWGNIGYTPETATALVRNILFWRTAAP